MTSAGQSTARESSQTFPLAEIMTGTLSVTLSVTLARTLARTLSGTLSRMLAGTLAVELAGTSHAGVRVRERAHALAHARRGGVR
jgi:hypothetical protein